MAAYLIYRTDAGSATARPVVGWGQCADGAVAQQAPSAAEIAVAAPMTLIDGQIYTYNPATQAVAAAAQAVDPPSVTDAERQLRDALRDSEWSQLPDAPLTAADVAAWAAYRADLRELPQTTGWPSPTWPVPPTTSEF